MSEASVSRGEAEELRTLSHDLAARVLLLEPGDVAAIAPVLEGLRRLATSDVLGLACRELARVALDRLVEATKTDGSARAAHIDNAARALAELTTQNPCVASDPGAGPSSEENSSGPSGAAVPARSTDSTLAAQDPEHISAFLDESRENLTDAEAALITLEASPTDKEAIGRVFRAFHTIKGVSAFLGLEIITTFAHAAESLLSRVRSGEVRCVGRNLRDPLGISAGSPAFSGDA